MKNFRMIVIFGMLSLTACAKTFFVNVEKGVGNNLSFCFYSDANRTNAVEKTVTRMSVLVEQNDGAWTPIWAVEGRITGTCVQYGVSSGSFHTVTAAEPLAGSKHYRVGITDDESPTGYASLNFSLDTLLQPSIDQ